MTKFVIEKDYRDRDIDHYIKWCKDNIECDIDYIYHTNVIPERARFSFKNEEDFVLFKLTWEYL